jgi:hypothetical protein
MVEIASAPVLVVVEYPVIRLIAEVSVVSTAISLVTLSVIEILPGSSLPPPFHRVAFA